MALLNDQTRMQKRNPIPNRALCDIRTSSLQGIIYLPHTIENQVAWTVAW